jgi:hypothetical protein
MWWYWGNHMLIFGEITWIGLANSFKFRSSWMLVFEKRPSFGAQFRWWKFWNVEIPWNLPVCCCFVGVAPNYGLTIKEQRKCHRITVTSIFIRWDFDRRFPSVPQNRKIKLLCRCGTNIFVRWRRYVTDGFFCSIHVFKV